MSKRNIPVVQGVLRRHMIHIPEVILQAGGIKINGKLIRSLAFTTDVAVIRNIDSDGIIAVYPFTPQPVITQTIMSAADVPVFCGIGGGLTNGIRTVNLALHAEFQGAAGVVLNAPVSNDLIKEVASTIDIPIIITVLSENCDVDARLSAGANILNISGSKNTSDIVREIRKRYPSTPIIATGGPTEESIIRTIEAGADCITYTPPSTGELFSEIMDKYRQNEK